MNNLKLDEARRAVEENFYGMEDYVDILEIALTRSMEKPLSSNVIFYGPGGYGKSEMDKLYLEVATGAEPFIVTFHEGMTQAEQAGGYDIPALQQGELKYLLEYSFMNHEVVIMEEMLDARPQVLASLKQTLTSGVFSFPGIKPFPIKTKVVIGVTNRDTSEFEDDDSSKALLERFPLRRRVSWDHLDLYHRREGINSVIKKFTGSKADVSTYARKAIEEIALNKGLSPRIIGRITEIYLTKREIWASRNKRENGTDLIMSVLTDMGHKAPQIEKKVDEAIFEEEMKKAEKSYNQVFMQIETIIRNIRKLSDKELKTQAAMNNYLPQIRNVDKTLQVLNNAVISIRMDTTFGHLSDELASKVNIKIGEYQESVQEIKNMTWDYIADEYNQEMGLIVGESLVDENQEGN